MSEPTDDSLDTEVETEEVSEVEQDEEAELQALAEKEAADRKATELNAAKQEAKEKGVDHHPSIGLEKLTIKLRDHDKETAKAAEKLRTTIVPPPQTQMEEAVATGLIPNNAFDDNGLPVIHQSKPVRSKAEALALVHVMVTSLDTMKKNYPGEIFTVGNSVIGTVKKMVPFGVEWHIPQIMFNMLNEKKYMMFTRERNAQGMEVNATKLSKAYAIQVLPKLTDKELNDLRITQAARNQTAA